MAGKTEDVPLAVKASDLPVRLASGLVMLAVSAGAVMAGDPWLDLFVVLVVAATLAEFVRLAVRATSNMGARVLAIAAGTAYIALAGYILIQLPVPMIIGVIGSVIFVDSFAYAFGRTLGGPKIAPSISPSKTWAGLLGGVAGASVWLALFIYVAARQISGPTTMGFDLSEVGQIAALGAVIAVAAQSGDFLESWMKRKAGMKDSSNLIPGHGGVFDRTDGIIPVVLLAGLFFNVLR